MDMPKDIIEAIFLHLSTFDIARGRTVCKFWDGVLRNREFLIKHAESNTEDWLALFSHSPVDEKRKLLLYNDASCLWHAISLDFLPSEFTDVIAADGGLVCIAGQFHRVYSICVCNIVTRTYKILPHIDEVPYAGAMIVKKQKVDAECSYEIAVLLVNAVAFTSSSRSTWVKYSTMLSSMPQSPVMCNRVLYGLQNMLSPWKSNWRLVYAKLDDTSCKEVWSELYHPTWGGIIDILHQPCLVESIGCLLLVGGLGHSLTTNSCITLIILKLDLGTLEWSEATRMPQEFYKHFDCNEDLSIFSHNGNVSLFSKAICGHLVCKLADGQSGTLWQWVEGCPLSSYETTFLSKGFLLKLGLDRIS
ncbi:hypothetical protein KP509_18G036800 [Ceratopteris richardii]|uniref:F-box domain-containing protein n=1 Tax=Ceratopteris richardii TaxID=49495 RepID=A0A8T2SNU4_CERRI|nr:hypothetical protein KP509_18G036800 [Ceratopteris richardii]